jgi:hypothetical protein
MADQINEFKCHDVVSTGSPPTGELATDLAIA